MRNKPNDELEVVEFFYYDETSPTFLRYKTDSTGRGFSKTFAGGVAGKLGTSGYMRLTKTQSGIKKSYAVHRIVWALHNGPVPVGFEIDHVDGNTVNNRLSNLRCVTIDINARNKRASVNNSSGATGVNRTVTNAGHEYWTARWMEDGRARRRHFSIQKLGDAKAKEMATAFREAKLSSLNLQGYGYSERHGAL